MVPDHCPEFGKPSDELAPVELRLSAPVHDLPAQPTESIEQVLGTVHTGTECCRETNIHLLHKGQAVNSIQSTPDPFEVAILKRRARPGTTVHKGIRSASSVEKASE